MTALRRRIDALDDKLVVLLARRQREIEQAAGIKRQTGLPARTPARVNEVIARVCASAQRENLSIDLATTLWTAMIEWSIGHEGRLLQASHDALPEFVV